jgi:hypothetical protein
MRARVVRKLLLGIFRAAQNACHRLRPVGDVNAVLEFEVLKHVLDDLVVEIVAAEMIVAVARDDFHEPLLNPHDGDIEGPAAEIVDQDSLTLMLRCLVDQRRSGRFIDDARHFEPGDLAGLACSLSLRVREIRRHGDHRLADRPSQPRLGNLLQARQDDRRDLLRCVFALAKLHLGVAAHPPFDRADGSLGIEQELVARLLADEQFPGLGEPDHRGQDDASLVVAERLRATIPVYGDFRVGGAEVDAEDLVRHHRSPLPASPLLTITSAVRNTWSSQRNPARTSLITDPSAAELSAAVPMARANRGSKGKPANWVATTRRSSRT